LPSVGKSLNSPSPGVTRLQYKVLKMNMNVRIDNRVLRVPKGYTERPVGRPEENER
jgi:hypothetical protein